jgi:hypothetical protein
VPAALPAEQAVGLDEPRLAAVVEAQPLDVADRGGDRRQLGRVDLGVGGVGAGVLGGAVDDRGERLDRGPQPGRQHLLELRQRAGARLGDSGDSGGGAQADRDGHGLLVVEEQRRQLAAGAEPVPARRPQRGVDGVVECAQAFDVVSHGAGRDAQPCGELGSAPVGPRLQEREQGEQPGGCLEHGSSCLSGVSESLPLRQRGRRNGFQN